jgi:hypothetical protein
MGGGGGGGAGGALDRSGEAGFANTGGGGGGASTNFTGGVGGAGGSGIVVIRYPSGQGLPQATTGSPRTYIAGPYRVYVWVSSGSITF